MIVIDTSPVISLTAALGHLGLLRDLFGSVVVPHEVYRELVAGGSRDKAGDLVSVTPGIALRPQAVALPLWLASDLDLGEAAVIQTALLEGIDTVVLDELRGRRAARRAGLKVTGSLGILVLAKEAGLLEVVGDAVARIRTHGGWLDENLVARTLALAGE